MITNNGCYSINGQAFRVYRNRLGWSQSELGRRAGYSERVIRKAEAGGKLRLDTIQELAAAMSIEGQILSIADLTLNLESIARRFVESYDILGNGMLTACCDIFADDFTFNCPADPHQVSFAGEWTGKTGFQEFLNRFFGTFTRKAGLLKPVYMACENHAVARFDDQVSYHGQEMPSFWVNYHIEFCGGLVSRIDYEFDSLNLTKSIEAYRNQESG